MMVLTQQQLTVSREGRQEITTRVSEGYFSACAELPGWLHCIERKAIRKKSLLVSWVVPASTHNQSSFIVQHVWQLHEGFLRHILNHFSLGFHFIHCNKTLKHEMCWKAADNIWFVFSAIYTASVTISTWWSCALIGPNFTWISLWCQNPRQKLTGKPIRAEQDPGGLKLDFIGHHSTQDQWQVRIPLPPLHDNCARVCDNITSTSLFSDYQLTSYNKQPRCLTGKPSSRTRTCPRRCSRTRWTAPPRPSRSITSRRTSPPTSRRSSTRSTTRPGTASWAETSDRTSHTRLGKLIIGQLESTLSRTAHNASKVGIKHKWILVEQNRIEPSWTFLCILQTISTFADTSSTSISVKSPSSCSRAARMSECSKISCCYTHCCL